MSKPWIVKVSMGSSRAGWSAVYGIAEGTAVGTVAQRAQQLGSLHRAMLATNCWINYVSFSQAGKPRDSDRPAQFKTKKAGAGIPVVGGAEDGTQSNTEFAALQIKFKINGGSTAVRSIRCVPDDWIRSALLTSGIGALPRYNFGDNAAIGNGAFAFADPPGAVSEYMNFVVERCVSFEVLLDADTEKPVDPRDWFVRTYEWADVYRAGKKRVGQPYAAFRGRRRKIKSTANADAAGGLVITS